MLNDCRLKRYAFIAEGLDGPKEYPPESIRVTKRGRSQLLYSENPRMSLFINRQQILQLVAAEHREKMRAICEAEFIRYINEYPLSWQFPFTHSDPNNSRDNAEEEEKPQRTRNWYPKTGVYKTNGNTKWPASINIQLPKSKWDSEDEDKLSSGTEKDQKTEVKPSNVVPEPGNDFNVFIILILLFLLFFLVCCYYYYFLP